MKLYSNPWSRGITVEWVGVVLSAVIGTMHSSLSFLPSHSTSVSLALMWRSSR